MKLMVTVGNAQGETEELVFELADPITWLGVEIDDPRDPEESQSRTGRMTIVRIPFANHEAGLHTMCQLNGGIEEVPML